MLRPAELAALKRMDYRGWRSAVLDATWPAAEGAAGLEAALDRICSEASAAIEDGVALLVLSDRAAGAAPRRWPASRERGLAPAVVFASRPPCMPCTVTSCQASTG